MHLRKGYWQKIVGSLPICQRYIRLPSNGRDVFRTLSNVYNSFFRKKYLLTLRKKCPYSELFWSVFSCIRTQYGKILLQSVPSFLSKNERNNNNHKNNKTNQMENFWFLSFWKYFVEFRTNDRDFCTSVLWFSIYAVIWLTHFSQKFSGNTKMEHLDKMG